MNANPIQEPASEEALRAIVDDAERRAAVPAAVLVETFLERIAKLDPQLNAFITVTEQLARANARQVDEARARGRRLPLDGLPMAIKDNIDVAGVRTTVASRFFADHVASEDAAVVGRLRDAGAIVLGKTMLHEFAFGATTTNPPPYGACRNPWDLTRVAGGSSGGSAAALAADLCLGALGSDTGGSVRIPAALTGVTGLRPTVGRVGTRGVFPTAWTFDQVGPMARSAEDVARIFSCIAGYDPADARSVEGPPALPPELTDGAEQPLRGLRVSMPQRFFFDGVTPDIAAAVRGAADVLASLGATFVEAELGVDQSICDAVATIIRAEALALHRQRLEPEPERFGAEILERLRLAEGLQGWEVAESLQRVHEWRRTLRAFFAQADVALTPTTRIVAPPIEVEDSVSTTWSLTYLTYPWSAAGTPAMSVPCGLSREGLPIGMQLVAPPWGERRLLEVAMRYQRATDWHRRRGPTP